MNKGPKKKAESSLGEDFRVTPKSETATRYPRITLRLSEAEDSRLRDMSQGMSVSAYIRKCVFGADAAPRKRRSYAPVADQKALARVLYLLGQTHFANNLNQIAYHAHIGTLAPDAATEEDIKLACAHIAFMRVKLIEALGIESKD